MRCRSRRQRSRAGPAAGRRRRRGREFGDPVAGELLPRGGPLVGETLAALVNFYTPAMVLLGAAFMVVDELLSRERIRRWIPYGTRAGRLATGAGGPGDGGGRGSPA